MVLDHDRDISVFVTSIYMKCVGFWLAANPDEERRRNFALIYTAVAVLFATWIQTRDFYYSWGDISGCVYIMCNILSLTMVLFKILVLFVHKQGFLSLIVYTQRKFWHSNYDVYEKTALDLCKRLCTFFICLFTFLAQVTVALYIIRPLVENIGRNESDRMLPFNMRVDLPLSMTPYYEIMFVAQVLSVYHVGICYFCFDNLLCIMNLHAATQFRILQYRMANINRLNVKSNVDEISNTIFLSSGEKYYITFRDCIKQHQALIKYCDTLETVFNFFVLGQVLVFSLLICVDGYQVIMADTPGMRRLIFIFHLLTSMCQLLMFTYSCDCLMRESTEISSAVYHGPWSDLSMNKYGKMVWKDLLLVSMRSRIPCCLTARGFFIVSLETYTGILSTAMSYFTMLKQHAPNT